MGEGCDSDGLGVNPTWPWPRCGLDAGPPGGRPQVRRRERASGWRRDGQREVALDGVDG